MPAASAAPTSRAPAQIHLRLPALHRTSHPLLVRRKLFSWRRRRARPLRPLTASDDLRLLAFWRDRAPLQPAHPPSQLALETDAVRHLSALRPGASLQDAAHALHHRLLGLLDTYATTLQHAQSPDGALIEQQAFDTFALVFTALAGRQLVFRDVQWDDKRRVWTDVHDDDKHSNDPSASVTASCSALTIASAWTAETSSPETSQAASSAPSAEEEPSVQQEDMVAVRLPVPHADTAAEPLVMRKIVFDWEPEKSRLSNLRAFSAIDNAALVTYWKTHAKDFLDKPELVLERNAVQALSARRKLHLVRDASYELHHKLVYLLETYSSVLRQAGEHEEVILDPKVFTDFASVYTALGRRDVMFESACWNKKEKIWEEPKLDIETSLNDSPSVANPSKDGTTIVTGKLPPRKRRCSSNDSSGKTNRGISRKDDNGEGVEPDSDATKHKRRRLTKKSERESSPNGVTSRERNSCTVAVDDHEQKGMAELERKMRREELREMMDRVKREKASHAKQEERLDSKAEHERRVVLLRELCQSALALHAAGMRTHAETIMSKFIALVDET